MKYMGSKRWMLRNGLGDEIDDRVGKYDRFVDLFCGSAAVSWHVAEKYDIPVLANDLQEFSRALAASVICRTTRLGHHWIDSWISRATAEAEADPLFPAAQQLELYVAGDGISIAELTDNARVLCDRASTPITSAYGGYYYSPVQAIHFDHLRRQLPARRPHRLAALGALVETASSCAASPGHTAQPFSPNDTAGPYLLQSWSRDVLQNVRRCAELLSGFGARVLGSAIVGDANAVASKLREGDLVFVDPPYSAVHYSRFYHVLETITVGREVSVSGTGRYPPREFRPQSRYSQPSESSPALEQLFTTIADRKCGVLMTFPAGSASNGLSGDQVTDMARKRFEVKKKKKVASRFSTLGGNTRNRDARVNSDELLLSLVPR